GLLARAWELGNVAPMLEAAGVDASRPEDLPAELGVRDGKYFLSEAQARAILELRLHRLTGLEHEKIVDEYKALLVEIGELLHILTSPERLMEVIREELERVKAEFGDERRTEITAASGDINIEDLIAQEDVVVTLSHAGYVKYQPLSDYEAQRRGGKGKSATKMKEDDFIEKLLVANTHDTILCFSSRGRLYQLKVYQLPQASRGARGTPIVNILPLVKEENERITAILPVPNGEFSADKFIFMATASGTVKKVSLDAFSNVRSSGLIALKLREGDELIGVDITNGESEIMLFSAQGRVVRFAETQVRGMGRVATGVRGIKLATTEISDEVEDVEIETVENEDSEETSSVNLTTDKVVSLVIPHTQGEILTVTQNGYGKRTALSEYPVKSRATKGVVSIKVNERNGKVVAAVQVEENDQIMLITDAGTLVRTRVNEVSLVGRNTQGVRIIRTADDEHVVSLERICEVDEEEDFEEAEA
ncbi:DNA gyrase C-terminal beta-propeller domain-containing protein, partial [Actinobacillus minor]|uniref:DNA gyrase C-terminal beta-propeller domain-containing protein n=1 Tax=Actinobacillus minor TaxID=51047 RepID=UPI0026EC86B3